MKNTNKIAKTTALSLLLGLAATTSVSAWGPERTTFTMDSPATYPTFNSITDNPTIGDERDFVRVGEIDAELTDMTNEVEVRPGHQYLVYIYFHNNASSIYNSKERNRSGIALKTRMASSFSTVLTPNEKGKITATITAENTNPTSVWDEAYMTTTTEKVLLHYVSGSAKIRNNWKTNGSIMPSSLFTKEGTLMGLNELNGIIPGCEEYHGVVTYVLEAEELGGSIEKTVSNDGEAYNESTSLKPGEEAYFRLTIRNTGDVALTNAIVKDVLPEGLVYIPGSAVLVSNDSTTENPLPDGIFETGYNLGTIGTGNTVYIRYKVKAEDDFDCTGKELKNSASLTYDSDVSTGDTKTDTSAIIVKKEDGCEEPEVPLDTCEANPSLPECQPEKTCKTNPEMEGCQELPTTGPLEIIMAIIVIVGIGGAGYYLYRTRKTLKTVENTTTGKTDGKTAGPAKDDDSSQKQ